MPATMKAAVARDYGQPLRIEEVPVPEPGPGQVVVRVSRCGVCHSDVHAVDGDWPAKAKMPLIPGHEVTGHVAKAGQGVANFKEGDAVGVPWINHTCGHCELCLTGWENFCRQQQSTGYFVDGGFAEYVLGWADYVTPLPAGIDMAGAAPVLCAGLTSYKAIKESGARPGEWLAVVGVGGLGHLAVEYGKAMGLNVAAVDVADDKLALAKRLGADLTVNSVTEPDPGRVIRKVTGGCHGVVVTAVSLSAYQQARGMVRTRGALIMVGLPNGNLEVPIVQTLGRGIMIRGSSVGNRKDLQEALAFFAAGKIKPSVEEKPLDAVNEVIDGLRKGTIQGRIVLRIG
jgi:propanol-preferring alcohol dehydrogenase